MSSIQSRRFIANLERRTEEMVSAISFVPIREMRSTMRRVRDELREVLEDAANSALRGEEEVTQALERMRDREVAWFLTFFSKIFAF